MESIREAIKIGMSKASICRNFRIKRSTLYDALYRETPFSVLLSENYMVPGDSYAPVRM